MTEQRTACLTCKHVRFNIPADWKPQFNGEKYDSHDARNLIRETKHHLDASCTLPPVWIPITTDHYCGQWSAARTEQHQSLDEFLWGTWQGRKMEYLTKTNAKLRARLKEVSRISASRLARLRGSNANGSQTQTAPPETDNVD